jgi:DNA-binding transcriptional LysR family regulator
MRPTPRALALIDPVRITLAQITALVSWDETFDPRTAERLFRIGLPDSVEVRLGPALLVSFGISLEVRIVGDHRTRLHLSAAAGRSHH